MGLKLLIADDEDNQLFHLLHRLLRHIRIMLTLLHKLKKQGAGIWLQYEERDYVWTAEEFQ